LAAQSGHEAMVNFLLRYGANANKQALKNFEVIFKADGTSLMINEGDKMDHVLQGGKVTFGEKGGKGRTPLHAVIRMTEGAIKKHGKQLTEERAIPIVQSLMAVGSDIYIEDFPWGLTPLDWVIHNNQEKLFDALVAGRKKQLGITDVVVPKDKKTNDKGKGKA
jgi:ankyrin repeat protein